MEAGSVLWQQELFDANSAEPRQYVFASPTIVNGTVYFGTPHDPGFYAFDAANGMQKWESPGAYPVQGGNSPAVVDNRVYYNGYTQAGTEGIFCLDASSGNSVWTFDTKEPGEYSAPQTSTVTVADGKAFFGTEQGSLYAVDAQTGDELWTYTQPSDPDDRIAEFPTTPTVVDGTVYAATYGGRVIALNTKNGDERWGYETEEHTVQSSPTVADGKVYFGTNNAKTVALNKNDGSVAWKFNANNYFRAAPTVADGTVYFGQAYEKVSNTSFFAVDAATGTEQWQFKPETDVFSSPTTVGDALFVGANDGNLYALNTADGTVRWSYETGGPVRSSPTVVDGVVYVASDDGHLYAIAAGVAGSSDGSRVSLGTLGHHHVWARRASTQSGLATTFETALQNYADTVEQTFDQFIQARAAFEASAIKNAGEPYLRNRRAYLEYRADERNPTAVQDDIRSKLDDTVSLEPNRAASLGAFLRELHGQIDPEADFQTIADLAEQHYRGTADGQSSRLTISGKIFDQHRQERVERFRNNIPALVEQFEQIDDTTAQKSAIASIEELKRLTARTTQDVIEVLATGAAAMSAGTPASVTTSTTPSIRDQPFTVPEIHVEAGSEAANDSSNGIPNVDTDTTAATAAIAITGTASSPAWATGAVLGGTAIIVAHQTGVIETPDNGSELFEPEIPTAIGTVIDTALVSDPIPQEYRAGQTTAVPPSPGPIGPKDIEEYLQNVGEAKIQDVLDAIEISALSVDEPSIETGDNGPSVVVDGTVELTNTIDPTVGDDPSGTASVFIPKEGTGVKRASDADPDTVGVSDAVGHLQFTPSRVYRSMLRGPENASVIDIPPGESEEFTFRYTGPVPERQTAYVLEMSATIADVLTTDELPTIETLNFPVASTSFTVVPGAEDQPSTSVQVPAERDAASRAPNQYSLGTSTGDKMRRAEQRWGNIDAPSSRVSGADTNRAESLVANQEPSPTVFEDRVTADDPAKFERTVPEETVRAGYLLSYPAGNLDLHLNVDGNHIGLEGTTFQNEVDSAVASGTDDGAGIEEVVLTNPEPGTSVAVRVETDSEMPREFTLVETLLPDRPAKLALAPAELRAEKTPGDTLRRTVTIKEVSGVSTLQNVRLSIEGLQQTDESGTIPPDATVVPDSQVGFDIEAGGFDTPTVEISVPSESPTGRYEGRVDVRAESAAGEVSGTIPVRMTVRESLSNVVPKVSAQASTPNPAIGEDVRLQAVVARDLDGRVETIEWDVDGDNRYEKEGREVIHSFDTSGETTVLVRAIDDDGGMTVERIRIDVGAERASDNSSSAGGSGTTDADGSLGVGTITAAIATLGGVMNRLRRNEQSG